MKIVAPDAAGHPCLGRLLYDKMPDLELKMAPGSTQCPSGGEALIAENGTYPASRSELLVPSNTSLDEQKSPVSFLDLPSEIRLQIYHLVHISSPVQQPQLAPWYPISNCRTHIVQAAAFSQNDDDDDDDDDDDEAGRDPEAPTHAKLLSPHRPLCRIPTALLQTSRQVYAEARTIPFHANEFVFINCFSSGLGSGVAFGRARHGWQRDALRWVRLEVFARDVAGRGAARFEDWCRLCEEFWGVGLRGLRLTVLMEGGGAYQACGTGTGTGRGENKSELGDAWELVEGRTEWITQGLGKLGGLRQLEVELADVRWTGRKKVTWCGKLRELLMAYNGGRGVSVVCVEKKAVDGRSVAETRVSIVEASLSPLGVRE